MWPDYSHSIFVDGAEHRAGFGTEVNVPGFTPGLPHPYFPDCI
jgi:hypothetical protein